FMVRDRKKYADTGGWGYALFDGNKTTYEGDPKTQAQACYACHQIAFERAQVFSVPMRISALTHKLPEPPLTRAEPIGAVKFETLAVSKLPEVLQRSLPNVKSIRSVQGEVRKHVFRGTIDEIRPTLIAEAVKTGMPAALVEEKGNQFAAVFTDKARTECG